MNCKLCDARDKTCLFESVPKIRPGRVPKNRPVALVTGRRDGPVASTNGGLTSPPKSADFQAPPRKNSNWRMQHVGLSSDQDPFLLQYCSFNDLNYFRRPDWVCLRVKQGGGIPMLFTVGSSLMVLLVFKIAELMCFRWCLTKTSIPDQHIILLSLLMLWYNHMRRRFFSRILMLSTILFHC